MLSVVVSIDFLPVDTGLVRTVVEANTTVGDLVLERGSIYVERGVELGGEFVERHVGLVGELIELDEVMAVFLGLGFGGVPELTKPLCQAPRCQPSQRQAPS